MRGSNISHHQLKYTFPSQRETSILFEATNQLQLLSNYTLLSQKFLWFEICSAAARCSVDLESLYLEIEHEDIPTWEVYLSRTFKHKEISNMITPIKDDQYLNQSVWNKTNEAFQSTHETVNNNIKHKIPVLYICAVLFDSANRQNNVEKVISSAIILLSLVFCLIPVTLFREKFSSSSDILKIAIIVGCFQTFVFYLTFLSFIKISFYDLLRRHKLYVELDECIRLSKSSLRVNLRLKVKDMDERKQSFDGAVMVDTWKYIDHLQRVIRTSFSVSPPLIAREDTQSDSASIGSEIAMNQRFTTKKQQDMIETDIAEGTSGNQSNNAESIPIDSERHLIPQLVPDISSSSSVNNLLAWQCMRRLSQEFSCRVKFRIDLYIGKRW